MRCPYCNRQPSDIEEYKEQAQAHEMSVEEYVRMDEGTFHSPTQLFCCTSCYIRIGMPLNGKLHEAFHYYRHNVVPLERR